MFHGRKKKLKFDLINNFFAVLLGLETNGCLMFLFCDFLCVRSKVKGCKKLRNEWPLLWMLTCHFLSGST